CSEARRALSVKPEVNDWISFLPLLALTLLTGCDRPPEPPERSKTETHAAAAQDGGRMLATDGLRKDYELLKSGRTAEPSRLWTPGERAGGIQRSLRHDSEYERWDVRVGRPGRIEGAAGSLYVTIPVQIHGIRRGGADVHLLGAATLRRSNDVPGATAEQRS